MINVEISAVWQSSKEDIFGEGTFFHPSHHPICWKKDKHVPALEGFIVYKVVELQLLTFIEPLLKCGACAKFYINIIFESSQQPPDVISILQVKGLGLREAE